MKIRHHKPVSVYTHPSITDYEFDRMKKVERLYVAICTLSFMIIILSFPFILMSRAKEEVKHPVSSPILQEKVKPIAFVVGEVTIDDSSKVEVNVGSTTIDTR